MDSPLSISEEKLMLGNLESDFKKLIYIKMMNSNLRHPSFPRQKLCMNMKRMTRILLAPGRMSQKMTGKRLQIKMIFFIIGRL